MNHMSKKTIVIHSRNFFRCITQMQEMKNVSLFNDTNSIDKRKSRGWPGPICVPFLCSTNQSGDYNAPKTEVKERYFC
jgi:hypothetical protein